MASVLAVSPAEAGLRLDDFRGHISLGYGQLVATAAPTGSMSFAGAVEYPIRPTVSAGIELGSSLLGTRLIEGGSQAAEIDYSLFEAVAFVRWTLPRGPFALAAGPGVYHARADLTSSAAAAFSEFALEKTVGGLAVDLTVIQRKPSPVRAGLELGLRTLWLPTVNPFVTDGPPFSTPSLTGGSWTVVSARLAIYY